MSGYGFTSTGTAYDDEDRLTGYQQASSNFNQSWSLTSVGDWSSVTTNGTAVSRTHGPTHELLTSGGQSVTTDVKGNQTVLPASLATQAAQLAFTWDYDNKLKSSDIDNNGSADVTFEYDALGRRVARTEGSNAVVYFQADQQTIADYPRGGAASTATYRYVFASYIDEPIVRKTTGSSGTVLFFHRNQQYSILALTDSSGNVSERYAYTAYGQPTFLDSSGSQISNSAISNRYTYTAREWDATLGLYHFRARWMSGLTGRFLSRDPIGFKGGLNLFRYCVGLDGTDPSGLKMHGGKVCCKFRLGFLIPQYETKEISCEPWLAAGDCCQNYADDWLRHWGVVASFSGPCDRPPNPIQTACVMTPVTTTTMVMTTSVKCGKVMTSVHPMVITTTVLMCSQSLVVDHDPNVGFPPIPPKLPDGPRKYPACCSWFQANSFGGPRLKELSRDVMCDNGESIYACCARHQVQSGIPPLFRSSAPPPHWYGDVPNTIVGTCPQNSSRF
jgi:RHS repeat-associated protein